MKVLDFLSRWLGYFSAAFIIFLMLIVTADVCGRYFFNNPIIGASELARYSVIAIVFPAMAWTALSGRHIRVDFIMNRFPRRVQAITNASVLILTLVIYSIITWQSILYSLEVESVISALDVPQAPFYWVMVVGWTVFCAAIIVLLIRNITEAVKR